MLRVASLGSVLLAGTASAEMTVASQTWVCERGVRVPVTRVSETAGAVMVLNVEGSQITLHAEAGGDRFSWPSGGSGYVWTEDDGIASILWRNRTDGTEAVILAGCKPT